jgi:hypothetical protein
VADSGLAAIATTHWGTVHAEILLFEEDGRPGGAEHGGDASQERSQHVVGPGHVQALECRASDRPITFRGRDSSVATAPYQYIGSYSLDEGTWLWSWANASVLEPLTRDASLVRDYGAKEGLERLTAPKLVCTEYEAWEFVAVACHLAQAKGVYRGPSGQLLSFMTFGEVTVGQVS